MAVGANEEVVLRVSGIVGVDVDLGKHALEGDAIDGDSAWLGRCDGDAVEDRVHDVGVCARIGNEVRDTGFDGRCVFDEDIDIEIGCGTSDLCAFEGFETVEAG